MRKLVTGRNENMSKKKRNRQHVHALPIEAVRERVAHRASGASGVHSDQKTSTKRGQLKRNRANTRQNQRRDAINDQL